MRKKERVEQILKRAKELALSGECQEPLSIEIKMKSEGYLEARQVLRSPSLREELRVLCDQARGEKGR